MACARNVDLGDDKSRVWMGPAGRRVCRIGGADKEGAPIVPAQHAGDRLLLGGDAIKLPPAFLDTHDGIGRQPGHPNRAFGVETDAVGCDVGRQARP